MKPTDTVWAQQPARVPLVRPAGTPALRRTLARIRKQRTTAQFSSSI